MLYDGVICGKNNCTLNVYFYKSGFGCQTCTFDYKCSNEIHGLCLITYIYVGACFLTIRTMWYYSMECSLYVGILWDGILLANQALELGKFLSIFTMRLVKVIGIHLNIDMWSFWSVNLFEWNYGQKPSNVESMTIEFN